MSWYSPVERDRGKPSAIQLAAQCSISHERANTYTVALNDHAIQYLAIVQYNAL